MARPINILDIVVIAALIIVAAIVIYLLRPLVVVLVIIGVGGTNAEKLAERGKVKYTSKQSKLFFTLVAKVY